MSSRYYSTIDVLINSLALVDVRILHVRDASVEESFPFRSALVCQHEPMTAAQAVTCNVPVLEERASGF